MVVLYSEGADEGDGAGADVGAGAGAYVGVKGVVGKEKNRWNKMKKKGNSKK